ncbi:hypothetical protein [Roseospira goensis]|uniref:Putative phiE125 gp8 family phage protein n=1 Tax=Roseospira goensis TaxID=391922 RepID=A0A7W6S3H2_9PROT|nr:hypothetical protein [Roseospira goensis]MBB4287502.1 putative phiE125 gp8 family phage protein [Roseospira goensis]
MLTIEDAPDTDLVTLASVKTALSVTGTGDDAWLGDLIDRASAAVVSFCGWPILSGSYSETIETDGRTHTILLSRFPVSAVTGLTLDGVDVTADMDWKVQAGGGLTRWKDHRSTPWPRGAVVVEYDAGYATAPDDVQAATIELVRQWFDRNRDPNIKATSYADTTSVSYVVNPPGLPAVVRDLLTPHRLPGLR